MDKIFKALADKNRRLIITMLKTGKMTVSQLVEKMTIGQATVSTHLSILKKSKLVESEVEGRWRRYKLNKEILCAFVKQLNVFCDYTEVAGTDELILRK